MVPGVGKGPAAWAIQSDISYGISGNYDEGKIACKIDGMLIKIKA